MQRKSRKRATSRQVEKQKQARRDEWLAEYRRQNPGSRATRPWVTPTSAGRMYFICLHCARLVSCVRSADALARAAAQATIEQHFEEHFK